jgi:hypothetical protein
MGFGVDFILIVPLKWCLVLINQTILMSHYLRGTLNRVNLC